MKRLITLVLCILITLSLSAEPDKVRMISIGIDYANSPNEDMFIRGTLNDAFDMTGAVKNIMEAKGVEFESVVMVQEGSGDYYVELTVYDESENLSLLNKIEDVLISFNCKNIYTTRHNDLGGNYYFLGYRMDLNTFEAVYKTLEDMTGWKDVEIHFFDIKETSKYPSSENILNEILLSADLDYDDLLIVYYSGHGACYNAFTTFDMENILLPYVRNGSLTRSEMEAILDLDTIIEKVVVDKLASMGVDVETIREIAVDMEESENYYPTGVLCTAYTWDNYYSSCSYLEMYMIYLTLALLKCDSVLILDACYSGYAADDLSDYINGSEYDHAVNIEVMCASTDTEISRSLLFETEDGEWEYHGTFTYEVLKALGWVHSKEKSSQILIPYYTVIDDYVVNVGMNCEIDGYTSFIPPRQTADEFFERVLENWDNDEQHPQAGDSTYLLYFIP